MHTGCLLTNLLTYLAVRLPQPGTRGRGVAPKVQAAATITGADSGGRDGARSAEEASQRSHGAHACNRM
eukprot:scaffold57169_cov43-Phaeocystis_antarctica.AAC.1